MTRQSPQQQALARAMAVRRQGAPAQMRQGAPAQMRQGAQVQQAIPPPTVQQLAQPAQGAQVRGELQQGEAHPSWLGDAAMAAAGSLLPVVEQVLNEGGEGIREDGTTDEDFFKSLYGSLLNTTGEVSEGAGKLIGAAGGGLARGANEQALPAWMDLFRDAGVTGGYEDIMRTSRDLLDPASRERLKAMAQEDVMGGVSDERDRALRSAIARGNRGGVTGTGAEQGIWGESMKQTQEGLRGVEQEDWTRRMQSSALGMQGLERGASQIQDLVEKGALSNKEATALIVQLLGELVPDELNFNPSLF